MRLLTDIQNQEDEFVRFIEMPKKSNDIIHLASEDKKEKEEIHLVVKDQINKTSSKIKKNKSEKPKKIKEKQAFYCSICNRKCISQSQLEAHERVHSKEKPFHCPFEGCNKSFSQNQNLKRHLKWHNNQKVFSCDQCDKQFLTKWNLKQHEKTHLDKVSRQIYKCKYCQKEYLGQKNLIFHEMSCHENKIQHQNFYQNCTQNQMEIEFTHEENSLSNRFQESCQQVQIQKIASITMQNPSLLPDKTFDTDSSIKDLLQIEFEENSQNHNINFDQDIPQFSDFNINFEIDYFNNQISVDELNQPYQYNFVQRPQFSLFSNDNIF